MLGDPKYSRRVGFGSVESFPKIALIQRQFWIRQKAAAIEAEPTSRLSAFPGGAERSSRSVE
jgi:hypothetical protein